MKLDIVETVMAIEQAFDIEMGDIEVENLQTVGDLHRAILRARHAGSGPSDAWSLLAKLFEPRRITDETPLSDLLD